MGEAAVAMTESATTESTTESTTQVSETDALMASQGISGISEAELRGDDLAKTDEKADESDKPENTDEELKTELTEEDKSRETEATEKKTADSEAQAEKPPKGYVPLAAIHEARGEIRSLKEQLQTIQSQLSEKSAPKEKEAVVADDFQVLSDDEFEELADDNPAQAIIYQRKLAAYEAQQRTKAEQAKQEAEFEQAYESIIDQSIQEIEKVAPGIFDPDQPVQKELMEFAETVGFTEDLYYLTNPSTKVILPGETEPLLLGEQAASILGLLVNVKAKSTPPDTSALEAKLRTEITAELMKKFKTTDTGAYRGLNQVPKSDTEIPAGSMAGKVLSTAQYEKLTPAEQEQYLAGN